jgi:hypothetical protein
MSEGQAQIGIDVSGHRVLQHFADRKRDPYCILGVASSADAADIQAAFQRLARKFLPDVLKQDPQALLRLTEVTTAFEFLANESKRGAFDRGEIDAEGNRRTDPTEGSPSVEWDGYLDAGESCSRELVVWQPEVPQKRRRGLILWTCGGVAALSYLWLVYGDRKAVPDTPTPAIPGWSELIACAYTTSFDGTKTLELSDDGKATLDESAKSAHGKSDRTDGSWSFDGSSNRYSLTIDNKTTPYTLLSIEPAGTCMLVKGGLDAADLHQSWFSSEFYGVDDDR